MYSNIFYYYLKKSFSKILPNNNTINKTITKNTPNPTLLPTPTLSIGSITKPVIKTTLLAYITEYIT